MIAILLRWFVTLRGEISFSIILLISIISVIYATESTSHIVIEKYQMLYNNPNSHL